MRRLNAVPKRELTSGEAWQLDVDEERGLWRAPDGATDDDIVAAVESLREPYRSVIEMRYWGRMTYEQIAKELGWPNRTWTSTYMKRAMQLLTAELSQRASLA